MFVRYNESRVIQEIQFTGSRRNLLYSNPAFIEENKTKDIVVSDWPKKQLSWLQNWESFGLTIVVTNRPLDIRHPCGVATDSIGNILVADCGNSVIHMIDKTGQFLLFIDSCHLQYP